MLNRGTHNPRPKINACSFPLIAALSSGRKNELDEISGNAALSPQWQLSLTPTRQTKGIVLFKGKTAPSNVQRTPNCRYHINHEEI